ncbi:MAG: hypothetical protein IPI45_10975 [Saprospiraceae bacterium]|nr:hypothetical protein [Saprospiraceae bacterium]MBK7738283.1 hypothetical protein [Saprospiraceae bacterium]MBK7913143.1 hypothetical protein [Saprospiraceae bacterium]
MKLITVYLENGIQLEIQLNYLLIERILINNELVSSKGSLFGRVHAFNHEGHFYKVILTAGAFGWWLDIYRDGMPIIESAKHGCLFLLGIGITLILLLEFVYKHFN